MILDEGELLQGFKVQDLNIEDLRSQARDHRMEIIKLEADLVIPRLKNKFPETYNADTERAATGNGPDDGSGHVVLGPADNSLGVEQEGSALGIRHGYLQTFKIAEEIPLGFLARFLRCPAGRQMDFILKHSSTFS